MSLSASCEPNLRCASKIISISFFNKSLETDLLYLPALFLLGSPFVYLTANISPMVLYLLSSNVSVIFLIDFNKSPSVLASSDFLIDLNPLRFAI